ncbi:hypothetical protein MMC19_002226 [Ptychographa xylographoides]|nr:hypothetical protein [Ptychographa xylographoides]
MHSNTISALKSMVIWKSAFVESCSRRSKDWSNTSIQLITGSVLNATRSIPPLQNSASTGKPEAIATAIIAIDSLFLCLSMTSIITLLISMYVVVRYFFDSHALDQHTAAVHKFLCSQCDQQFLNRRDLADHQYALGHYYYAQRNELFADEQALAQHKVSVHTFDSSTTTNLETDQQVTSHWYCQICDRHFSDRDALKQHEVTVHSLICKQCDAEFVTQSSLKLHQIAKEHCYCQRCDLMFRENFTHQQHKLTAHTYRCDQCGEVCQSINLLEDHRKTTGHLFCQECDHFSKDKASHKPDLVPAPIDSEHDRRTEVTQEASEEAASSQPISHKLCNEDKQSQIPLVTLTFSTLGIKCISGNKCDEYFLSPVAAYQHIESGACKSGISEGRQATILQQFSEVFTASSRLAGSATPLDNLASVPAAPEQTRKMQEVASAPRVSTRSPEPSGKVSLLSRTVLGSGTPSSLESVFRSAIQNRPVTPLELETTVMRETKPNVVRGKGSSINSKSSTTSTPLHFTHNQ